MWIIVMRNRSCSV